MHQSLTSGLTLMLNTIIIPVQCIETIDIVPLYDDKQNIIKVSLIYHESRKNLAKFSNRYPNKALLMLGKKHVFGTQAMDELS